MSRLTCSSWPPRSTGSTSRQRLILSVRELANVFAAFRWGGLLRAHRMSAMEFPYSVAGLTAAHLKMRWPDITDDAPDKPGTRFRKPFGAVPVVLGLDYPGSRVGIARQQKRRAGMIRLMVLCWACSLPGRDGRARSTSRIPGGGTPVNSARPTGTARPAGTAGTASTWPASRGRRRMDRRARSARAVPAGARPGTSGGGIGRSGPGGRGGACSPTGSSGAPPRPARADLP